MYLAFVQFFFFLPFKERFEIPRAQTTNAHVYKMLPLNYLNERILVLHLIFIFISILFLIFIGKGCVKRVILTYFSLSYF